METKGEHGDLNLQFIVNRRFFSVSSRISYELFTDKSGISLENNFFLFLKCWGFSAIVVTFLQNNVFLNGKNV